MKIVNEAESSVYSGEEVKVEVQKLTSNPATSRDSSYPYHMTTSNNNTRIR